MHNHTDPLLFELARLAQSHAWKRRRAKIQKIARAAKHDALRNALFLDSAPSRDSPRLSPKQLQGANYETLALDLLMRAGLQLLARNVSCKMGEIDLIMQEGPTLVLVEVRARTASCFGSAAASVNHKKRTRLIRTATYLLPTLIHHYWQGQEPPVRFDVVTFDGNNSYWFRDAFMR